VIVVGCLSACGAAAPTTTSTAGRHATDAAASYVKPPAGIATVQLFQPLGQYTEYVDAQLRQLHSQLATLDRQIAADSLPGAETAWLAAHLTWLEIGQDDGAYGAFGNLGNAIDGTAEGDVGGTSSSKFTGFHRVELDLFDRHDVAAAGTDAAKLTALVDSISSHTVNADLPLNTIGLDSWVLRTHEILEDALRDSLSQDDDYGSHSDLASVRADVSATREMLKVLSGLIEPRSPRLVQTAGRQLTTINSALAVAPAGTEPSALPTRDRQRIDGAVDAALETLAPISELMQISNAHS
jgi:high-affinity iron transporter